MATKKEILERYKKVLEALTLRGELDTKQLKEVLAVKSEKIVWQCVTDLVDVGVVQKFHGGARARTPVKNTEFYRHLFSNVESKEVIGRSIIDRFLKEKFDEKVCIYLDSGSTSLLLFRQIVQHKELRSLNFKIVSNNTALTQESCPANITLILSGGRYSCEDECLIDCVGEIFSSYPAKYAILSASNLSYRGGFIGYNPGESRVKEAMIQNAEEIIIMADESKFRFTGGELIARFEWSGNECKRLELVPKNNDRRKPVKIITNETMQKADILRSFQDPEKGITEKEVEKFILFAPKE